MTMHPKNISIDDFNYNLPESFIAKFPLSQRDDSALLVYKNKQISKEAFKSLNDFLPENSYLIFNDSKVIHARILFKLSESVQIECFCLEPSNGKSPADAFSSTGPLRWQCMVGMARKWKSEILSKSFTGKHGPCTLSALKTASEDKDFTIEFDWDNKAYHFSEILEIAGDLPIPPYLNRPSTPEDEVRYNTVYAGTEGSVAAPTAGLHFTPEILTGLKALNHELGYVTLHVGAGTFVPVKSATMEQHEMHAERIEVSIETITALASLPPDRTIISVGTTSVRTIESLYWLGCRWMQEGGSKELFLVNQWEPYAERTGDLPSREVVFKWIEKYMREQRLDELSGYTKLIIAPGYSFRVIDALITNFHQPRSTLLLLVAALVGEDWRKIYEFALTNQFRFLSYGDSSLLFSNK